MDFSLLGLWHQMGAVAKGVVIILLIMSMMAIGVGIERLVAFRKGRRRSIEYVAALQPLISTRGRLHEALGLQFGDAPLARIIGTGLNEFKLGLERLGAAAGDSIELEVLLHAVGRSMERAKKREMAGLGKGMPLLATISSSAPFVGLFGTVFGIITAFQQMADPSKGGGGGLATVSAGIAEALLTTAVGLAVAIGSVWFYNFFTAKLDELGVLIDDASGELADRLSMHVGRAPAVQGQPATAAVPARPPAFSGSAGSVPA
jgi:biopolymer transport protein ExbB/TolQ